VQKPGESNSRTLSFRCRSLSTKKGKEGSTASDQSENRASSVSPEKYLFPLPCGNGNWSYEHLEATNSKVAELNSLSVLQLEAELKINNRPYSQASKKTLVEQCLFGRAYGRLPRCRFCHSFLSFHENNRIFSCNGSVDSSNCKRYLCPFTLALNVANCELWEPLFCGSANKVCEPCDFYLKFSIRGGLWKIKEEGSKPFHSLYCREKPFVTTVVATNQLENRVKLQESGNLSERSVRDSALLNDLGDGSRSTVRRSLEIVKKEKLDLPREEGYRKIIPWSIAFCKANPGTVCEILMKLRDGNLKRYRVRFEAMSPVEDPTFLSGSGLHGHVDVSYDQSAVQKQIEELEQNVAGLSSALNMKFLLRRRNLLTDPTLSINMREARLAALDEEKYLEEIELTSTLTEEIRLLKSLQQEAPSAASADQTAGEGFGDLNDVEEFISAEEAGTIIAICFVFKPCVDIWKNVGKNIFYIDGCHMKDGRTGTGEKGQLIQCVIEDTLDRIYNLGVCYCFSESAANITFLVDAITDAGVPVDKLGNIIMTDRSSASDKVDNEKWKAARPRKCEEHIIRNINQKYGMKVHDSMRSAIMNCFRALTKADFDTKFAILRQDHPKAYDYLSKIDLNVWASYTFVAENIPTFGRSNNNPAESQNHRDLTARALKSPLEAFLQIINHLSSVLALRQKEVMHMGNSFLAPAILGRFKASMTEASRSLMLSVSDANRGIFQARGVHNQSVLSFTTIECHTLTCSCGKWQDKRRPCFHAAAAASSFSSTFSDDCVYRTWFDKRYRVESYRAAFQTSLTVPSPEVIESAKFEFELPGGNQLKKKAGRPSLEKRIPSAGQTH